MPLTDLWLPILVAAVFVFVVSSVIHMALPIHRGDAKRLPQEDTVLDAMRRAGVGRGNYMFPHCGSMKEMGSPETIEKYRRGPVGSMIVLAAGPPAIGKALVQWFLLSLVIGVFVAYVGSLTLPAGSPSMMVFRVTGAVAMLGYGFGQVQDSIWKGLSWGVSLKFVFDGLVYGIATGAAFAWLWPGAV